MLSPSTHLVITFLSHLYFPTLGDSRQGYCIIGHRQVAKGVSTQMQDKPFGEEFNEILYKFLLRPESPPSDTLRVASLYAGGRISSVVEELDLDVVWEHQPTDTASSRL